MKNFMQRFSKKVIIYSPSMGIILIYNIINIFVAVIFYMLIPVILNYPPESINSKFELEVIHFSYNTQFFLIAIITNTIGSIILRWVLKGLDNWRKYLVNSSPGNDRKLSDIRAKCMNLPYTIYIFHIIFPLLVVILILLFFLSKEGHLSLGFVKVIILVFSFVTLVALISFILSKRIFVKILLESYEGQDKNGIRINLKTKLFLQVLPMFIVSLLFTSMIGYSRLIKDKGELLFTNYKLQLESGIELIKSTNDIKQILQGIDFNTSQDCTFSISPDGKIETSDGSILSDFFVKYLYDLSEKYDGRVYDIYAVDVQGVALNIKIGDENWIVGVKYDVASSQTVAFFLGSFIILLLLNILVLYVLSKSLADDISQVASSLEGIAEGSNIDFEKKLAVTSNDEIGDLVIAFNKIQQREKENIEALKENQAILIEQERLASLGQLIGGIAHNIRTPIMSISGAIEALKDLAYEYRDSIDDKSVTEQDHQEIAKEMLTWLDKMRPYCAYMSDVISAVKGQAVQMNASTMVKFTVDELIKRVELLMKHELTKNHITLILDSQIDMNTEIKGEVSNLIQVFDNIIINAVHAYEGKEGTIELKILRSDDNIRFVFKDSAKGISSEISDRLFKEMVTTKGKNGTGLGLYMSYATVKGRFGGNMYFDSIQGSGTTFYILIPCISYNQKEVS